MGRNILILFIHTKHAIGYCSYLLVCVYSLKMLRTLLLLAGFLLLRVEGQTPPALPNNSVRLFLPYEDRAIPDYSMIYARQFYNVDQNNDVNNINDALWCQSANNVSNIGVWYYPNGTEVPLFDGSFTDSSAPSPVFSKRFSGQIALARRAGISGYEGLYNVGTTASTTFNITSGLIEGSTYTFYVVSYGSASLPSGNASVILIISYPEVNDFTATEITSTPIALAWSPPTDVVPTSYNIVTNCRRVCESSFTSTNETSVTSPHTSTGIPPYSLCTFDLIGVYEDDTVAFNASTVATPFTGMISK
ncbi:PREDICTED: uncharacterized protein LOC109587745 [Amphimedon queenslandica]|uniref:Uncharacterized protein n=1 Tax=Amphimedon queenslandica TaxID=400682 RepID=A0AAN0JRP9_AMPQE|nr:PREDICTED: uncharacterized protein LOC109587745 [Amphimedon queenslandica]|eukprot:XP_019859528.1 PREDICTED: uncharacterized protein LOC109587745 [Amphimedon queenslandica]